MSGEVVYILVSCVAVFALIGGLFLVASSGPPLFDGPDDLPPSDLRRKLEREQEADNG